MAKAKNIKGLDCDANVLGWAKRTLAVRFDEMLELREVAVESDDIGAVHDMRVATRRLRSAIRDFSPLMRKDAFLKVDSEIKAIADALGSVRDQDVAIKALIGMRKKSKGKELKKGIDVLIDDRDALRARAQLDLETEIAEARLERLHRAFKSTLKSAVRQTVRRRVVSFNEAGRAVVGNSLQEFVDLTPNVYKFSKTRPLHKLRIRAKRLRYAMELYAACWGKKIEPFAEQIAGLQDYLGEIHDADVWLADLRDRLDSGDANPANVWLLARFAEKRSKDYAASLKLWDEWQSGNFIDKLRATVINTQ